jgi:hypothetical protein
MIAYFCIEDPLSRAVLKRLISALLGEIYLTELQPNQGGFGSMKKSFKEYCTLAKHHNVFILTDLDTAECAPSLRMEWISGANLTEPLPSNMHFRIAVKEIEAWLLADRDNLSSYLGLPKHAFPDDAEIPDPKEHLLKCVKDFGNSNAKLELLPEGLAKVGLGYNNHLGKFATEIWNFRRAADRSESLSRAILRIGSAR